MIKVLNLRIITNAREDTREASKCVAIIGHSKVYFMKSTHVIKRLKTEGWFEVKTRGSHVQLKHPDKPGRVTVPHPKRDIPIGTLKSIEKQAGIKIS